MKVKYLLVIPMLILAVIADYGWANGNYLTVLAGFSYVGWTLVFVLLYLLFRNFWYTMGTILIFSAIHDFLFNLWHAISGHYSLIPMHPDAPEKIYGGYVTCLGWVWFGLKSIYFIFPVLGILFILFGYWLKKLKLAKH